MSSERSAVKNTAIEQDKPSEDAVGDYLTMELNKCDMAYVFGQEHLNASLMAFLENHNFMIEFEYTIGNDLRPIPGPIDQNSKCRFGSEITFPTTHEDTPQPLPVVVLGQSSLPNQARFSIGFTGRKEGKFEQGFEFLFKQDGQEYNYIQANDFLSPSGQPYTCPVQIEVELKAQEMDENEVDHPTILKRLSGLRQKQGDLFSLVGILIDFSTSKVVGQTMTPPPGFNETAWKSFVYCIELSLQSNADVIFSAQPVLSYLIVQRALRQDLVMPTDVGILTQKNDSTPGKGVLVYGMSVGRSLPVDWRTDFTGYTNILPEGLGGVAMVSKGMHFDKVREQIVNGPYGEAVNCYMQPFSTKWEPYKTIYAMVPRPKGYIKVHTCDPTVESPIMCYCRLNEGLPFIAVFKGYDFTVAGKTTSVSQVSVAASLQNSLLFDKVDWTGEYTVGLSAPSANPFAKPVWSSEKLRYYWQYGMSYTFRTEDGEAQSVAFMPNSFYTKLPSWVETVEPQYSGPNDINLQAANEATEAIKQQMTLLMDLSISMPLMGNTYAITPFVFPGAGNFNMQTVGLNAKMNLVITLDFIGLNSKANLPAK